MLESITSTQLSEWMAYYELDPWGGERADLLAGIIASTIANCNRAKNQPAFKPKDFMPRFDDGRRPGHKKPRKTAEERREELKEAALNIVKAFGGSIQMAPRAMNDRRGPPAIQPPTRALNG